MKDYLIYYKYNNGTLVRYVANERPTIFDYTDQHDNDEEALEYAANYLEVSFGDQITAHPFIVEVA